MLGTDLGSITYVFQLTSQEIDIAFPIMQITKQSSEMFNYLHKVT